MPFTPTIDDIIEAHERILPHIHYTPVLSSESINEIAGCEIFFKCENFQKVGAFKMRGAANAVAMLSEEERAKGVATHSSGNHAQALAKAAKEYGIPAYIVMPETSPKVKVAAVKGYGAQVTFCAPNLQARESTLEDIVAKTGATFIHPYNDCQVIAGQATCAKELLEQVDELDIVMAPIGGGGLMSGTLLSCQYFAPETVVIGGEPAGADDAYQSWKSGQLIPSQNPKTIADGLLTSLGDKTFPIIQKHIKEIITVSEEEIIAAMKLIYERMKIIIEPSCAVPFAALLKEKGQFKEKRVGIILTGGNVDLGKLPF
jgi:threonine dehydratase